MNRAMIVCAAFAMACADKGDQDPPTYTRDVAPILDSRCVNCHQDGGIAPFGLTTYEEASTFASLIADAVTDRRMPPAQPVPGCQDYVPDPSLSDEEIAAISDWADAGAPQGDAADAVDVELTGDPNALDRVDLTLSMPEPYTVQTEPDDYRCFILDWPAEEDLYVTGLGLQPGNTQIVHHVIVFVIPPSGLEEIEALDAADEGPGYTCYGGPGGNQPGQRPTWLGGWAPGGQGRNMPSGIGTLVEAGSRLVMQVHYNTSSAIGPATDLSSALIKTDSTVDKVGYTQPFANPAWVLQQQMPIPAGEHDVEYSYSLNWTKNSTIHEVGLHMHEQGQRGSLRLHRADGSEECLLELDPWDFHWQLAYRLAEPIALSAGDSLELSCFFDNDSSEELNWGEATDQEMCLGVLYLNDED